MALHWTRWIEWNPRRWRWGTAQSTDGTLGFVYRGPYVRAWIEIDGFDGTNDST